MYFNRKITPWNTYPRKFHLVLMSFLWRRVSNVAFKCALGLVIHSKKRILKRLNSDLHTNSQISYKNSYIILTISASHWNSNASKICSQWTEYYACSGFYSIYRSGTLNYASKNISLIRNNLKSLRVIHTWIAHQKTGFEAEYYIYLFHTMCLH